MEGGTTAGVDELRFIAVFGVAGAAEKAVGVTPGPGDAEAVCLAISRILSRCGGMELTRATACSVLIVMGIVPCLEVASAIFTSSGVELPRVAAENAGFH